MARYRRIIIAFCLGLTVSLLTAQPAFAARVYNLLPITIWVGGIEGNITLKPGETSRSLSWGMSTIIDVDPAHVAAFQLCILHFGVHADLTGGNYLIVGHRGTQVTCSLCDSNGRVMHRDNRLAPEQYWSQMEKHSTKTGC